MAFLALFAAIPTKPKWNQQKVQSIKTEFFTRPNVKIFLKHLTFLLNNIPLDENDTYILELREAGERIGLRIHQNLDGIIESVDTDDDITISSVGERSSITTGMNSINSNYTDRSSHSSIAEAKNAHYWNEPLPADDPQLRTIMHEIALKSSVSANIFLVEQKRDRLIHAYVTLCGRVKRNVITSKLDDPEATDAVKFSELKGLFEINYFHSSTFDDIVYPNRKRLKQQLEEEKQLASPSSTSSLSPVRRRPKDTLHGSRSHDRLHYKSSSPSKTGRERRNVLRDAASLHFH